LSASKRKKAGKAAFAARIETLRALRIGMSDSGRVIQPGTPEYEKKLKDFAATLSEDEFQGLIHA